MILNFLLLISNASNNDTIPMVRKRNTDPPPEMFTNPSNYQFFEGKKWDETPEEEKKPGPLDCRMCGFPLEEPKNQTPNPQNVFFKPSGFSFAIKDGKYLGCATINCGKSEVFFGPPPATKEKFKIVVNRSKFLEKREKRKQAILERKLLEEEKKNDANTEDSKKTKEVKEKSKKETKKEEPKKVEGTKEEPKEKRKRTIPIILKHSRKRKR